MAKKKTDRVFTLEFFRKHAAEGGKIGGKRAAEVMTAEAKTARALKAVAARKWHPPVSEEEKARRAALPKKPVGRPRKVETPVPVEAVAAPQRTIRRKRRQAETQ